MIQLRMLKKYNMKYCNANNKSAGVKFDSNNNVTLLYMNFFQENEGKEIHRNDGNTNNLMSIFNKFYFFIQ